MKSTQEAYSSSWPIDSLLLLPTGHIPVKVVRASGKRRPILVASDSIATVLAVVNQAVSTAPFTGCAIFWCKWIQLFS